MKLFRPFIFNVFINTVRLKCCILLFILYLSHLFSIPFSFYSLPSFELIFFFLIYLLWFITFKIYFSGWLRAYSYILNLLQHTFKGYCISYRYKNFNFIFQFSPPDLCAIIVTPFAYYKPPLHCHYFCSNNHLFKKNLKLKNLTHLPR